MEYKYLNPKSVPHPDRAAEKLYYLSHSLWDRKRFLFAKILKLINTFIFRNHIHPNVKIGKRLELAHGGFGVVVHSNVIIGDDAIIFHNVTIGNGGATIGDRVMIGAGAIILGKIKIGDDVWIGANAVVNFDVPNFSTVVGHKSKIISRY